MNKKPLDARRKKYCRERAKGKTQVQAYFDAGYSKNNSHEAAKVAACRLEKDERIRAELDRLTRLAESGAILDRQQRISILSEMALDENRKDDSRQRALDMLNKMHGDYSEKQIIEARHDVTMTYEEKRQAVLDALMSDD